MGIFFACGTARTRLDATALGRDLILFTVWRATRMSGRGEGVGQICTLFEIIGSARGDSTGCGVAELFGKARAVCMRAARRI